MATLGAGDRGPAHVVIVFDDAVRAGQVGEMLAARAEVTVSSVERPVAAWRFMDVLDADAIVIITDGRLDRSDAETEARAHRLAGVVPTIVVRPRFDPARGPDPLAPFQGLALFSEDVDDQLIDHVVERAVATRATRHEHKPPQVVLAIGAHPDDVEIGVGGTLAAHAHAGDRVAILTMSRGARGGSSTAREAEARAAAALLGAELFLEDLPDTEFPSGGDTVRRIEAVVREVGPTIIYVHSVHDRHQDHRAVHHATRVAARTVPTLAAYQSPSSTVEFHPTEFVSIDGYIAVKLEVLAAYTSQDGRAYLTPESVRTTASYWSRFTGGGLVEPLEMLHTNMTVTDASRVDRPTTWSLGGTSSHDA